MLSLVDRIINYFKEETIRGNYSDDLIRHDLESMCGDYEAMQEEIEDLREENERLEEQVDELEDELIEYRGY